MDFTATLEQLVFLQAGPFSKLRQSSGKPKKVRLECPIHPRAIPEALL
jgi:hypothetical protein